MHAAMSPKFRIGFLSTVMLLASAVTGCADDERSVCSGDYDCASWQECSAGQCLDKPPDCEDSLDCPSGQECSGNQCVDEPTKPTKPPGTTLIGCNCNTTSFYPGQQVARDDCSSNAAVVQLCPGCCVTDQFGNCLGLPWTMVCL